MASQMLRSEAEHVRKAMTHGDLGLPGEVRSGFWLAALARHAAWQPALPAEAPCKAPLRQQACAPPHLHLTPSTASPPPPAEYAAAWEAVARDIIYVPAQQRYTRAASATAQDRVASLQVGLPWQRVGASGLGLRCRVLAATAAHCQPVLASHRLCVS